MDYTIELIGLILFIHLIITAMLTSAFDIGAAIAFKGDNGDFKTDADGLSFIVFIALICLFFFEASYVHWAAFIIATVSHPIIITTSFLIYLHILRAFVKK